MPGAVHSAAQHARGSLVHIPRPALCQVAQVDQEGAWNGGRRKPRAVCQLDLQVGRIEWCKLTQVHVSCVHAPGRRGKTGSASDACASSHNKRVHLDAGCVLAHKREKAAVGVGAAAARRITAAARWRVSVAGWAGAAVVAAGSTATQGVGMACPISSCSISSNSRAGTASTIMLAHLNSTSCATGSSHVSVKKASGCRSASASARISRRATPSRRWKAASASGRQPAGGGQGWQGWKRGWLTGIRDG